MLHSCGLGYGGKPYSVYDFTILDYDTFWVDNICCHNNSYSSIV